MPAIKLTRKSIESLPPLDTTKSPNKNQEFYRDTALPGFGLKVTKTSKLYIVEKRIHGRLHRSTLGKYPQLTPEQARELAQDTLYRLAKGVDVSASKNTKSITMELCFADFLNIRSLKDRTIRDYQTAMNKHFSDWKKKKVVSITRDMVSRRHKKLGDSAGHAQANLAMRFLRALLNFASGQYDDGEGNKLIKENPVSRLSETKQWFRVARRQTIIKSHQLPAWYQAVQNISSSTVRDYLLLILLTGLRREEGFRLGWRDVDLKGKTFVVADTKNKNPLQLPMGIYVYQLLKSRRDQNDGSEFVFSGSGKSGHLVEPKRQVAKVIDESGAPFCLHDLRRVFITTAESLDISSYAVHSLVNHSTGNDVTSGYIISDPERLRKPMQRIETHLLGLCQLESAKIVAFPKQ
jgi:integrase